MGRLYVGHYSIGHLLKLHFHAKNRIVYSHTSKTYTDFRAHARTIRMTVVLCSPYSVRYYTIFVITLIN